MATSSAINPYCVVPFQSLLYLKVTGLKLVDRFTGLVHRLNVVFELSGRRVEDAHHVKLIDKYCYLGAGVANWFTEDAADEAGVIKGSKRTFTRCADGDAVIDVWSQTGAGLVTDSDVRITVYVVIECVITNRCVKGARRVEKHGVIAHSIVLIAGHYSRARHVHGRC